MKPVSIILICVMSAIGLHSQTKNGPSARGILLEDLTWVEAEKVLTPDKVVVIPLGAESKEHGPHLKLKNDWLIAQYLRDRVLEQAEVVVAPTLNYSYYPAFLEYPGSTSLRLETARDVVVDICRSLARFGPHRFYVINTGVSTLAALKPAAELLASEGIVMRYTNILEATAPVEKKISKQEGGTHADEVETSIMLYIAPETVDMKKAVKDYHPGKGRLTRDPKTANGVYSPTGIFGDPTLATVEKGAKLTEALVQGVLREIEDLRRSPVPPQK
ncbi:MAG TPA: creatininase family protein [Candidatus Angelobacter sp.]|nr:creatininase family protein [Candidatus Angelobacter sp.]